MRHYDKRAKTAEKNHKQSFGTSDLGGEGAAWDVFVIKLDDDVVISRCGGQVGHSTRPVFVVFASDLGFRWTLNRQRQTTCTHRQILTGRGPIISSNLILHFMTSSQLNFNHFDRFVTETQHFIHMLQNKSLLVSQSVESLPSPQIF